MELIEHVLGNVSDPAWSRKLEKARVDVLELDQWDAQKNRLRKATRDGTMVAVSLDRDKFLRDGDVLMWNEREGTAVAARVRLCEVMAVSLVALTHRPMEEVIEMCVRIGHALGNQHWPAVIKGRDVFVPLTVDRKVMESVMATHRLKDISYSFIDGDQAMALLEPHEARRLFGGTEMPADGHTHGHAHAGHSGHGHRHGAHGHEGQTVASPNEHHA